MPRAVRHTKVTEDVARPTPDVSPIPNARSHAEQRRSHYTPILMGLLLIASFLLGMLVTKVQYLEKGASAQSANALPTQAPGTQQPGQPQQPQQITQAPTEKVRALSDKDHVRGDANAKVTLIEYSDLECPFCKRFHETMLQVMKEYDGKVKWAYRHYPLSFHQNAQKESEAAECVAELGGSEKFWLFIDKIFERTTSNGTGFALDKLGSLAAEVGVDQTAFQTCLDSGKYTKLVTDQMDEGTRAGVTGTPATFIVDSNGEQKLVVGAQPFESIKTVIDEALK